MTHLRFALLTILLAAFCQELRAAGGVHFTLVGARAYSDGDISGGGGPAWGVGVNAGGKNWPVNIDFGWQRASNLDLFSVDELEVEEISLGVRKTWAKKEHRTRPFVAGGLSFLTADLHRTLPGPGNNVDGTDHVNGGYVNGGVLWRFGGHFDLGVDARGVFGASADLDGTSLGVGYTQLGFFLGYGW